ncbi:MAG: bifunctional adenosylcobinamide kinase/adenosylcobinamide-phosphate guanylyltransferase [Comamonadaceae bacterium]|nr:MAG: bifunctional adenosylcobinamide kinase/adenosylcobinamide-phosphate guanylyltransferase [Comamonadaceae bacterium]
MNAGAVEHRLILGGQRSGKSRQAETLAAQWLAGGEHRRALLVATAQAHDDEMRERIERHREDRASRVPRMETVEEPLALAAVLHGHSARDTLIVVDCLTLWLTNLLMPASPAVAGAARDGESAQTLVDALLQALDEAAGPVVLVGNEIGLGVIPLGGETRAFVDALGRLNQQVAAHCERVTLMVAGCPLQLKGSR